MGWESLDGKAVDQALKRATVARVLKHFCVKLTETFWF